jgi:hypothetical protein
MESLPAGGRDARDGLDDKLEGFVNGADDYVVGGGRLAGRVIAPVRELAERVRGRDPVAAPMFSRRSLLPDLGGSGAAQLPVHDGGDHQVAPDVD